jgi:hypothetical protein
MARPHHVYLGNYPSNHDSDWTDGLQGVAHDGEHWYFTQTNKIYKFHVTTPLTRGASSAVSSSSMPAVLAQLGGDHFGDPDHIRWRGRGYLFVPVESGSNGKEIDLRPRIAVFSTDDALKYLGSCPLPSQHATAGTNRAGWCAIHPKTRLLHSSFKSISLSKPVFRYRIDLDALVGGRVNVTACPNLELRDVSRRPISIPGFIQGGTFSPKGLLYILSGRHWKLSDGVSSISARDGGIRVFDSHGVLMDRSIIKRSTRTRFRYEYKPNLPHLQEPEGLTYWDLDRIRLAMKIPSGLAGQLHALLLNTQQGRTDNIWFKHYQVK